MNDYVIPLGGWNEFFIAVENHWVTALCVVIALIFIANALSPTINNIITKDKDKDDK